MTTPKKSYSELVSECGEACASDSAACKADVLALERKIDQRNRQSQKHQEQLRSALAAELAERVITHRRAAIAALTPYFSGDVTADLATRLGAEFGTLNSDYCRMCPTTGYQFDGLGYALWDACANAMLDRIEDPTERARAVASIIDARVYSIPLHVGESTHKAIRALAHAAVDPITARDRIEDLVRSVSRAMLQGNRAPRPDGEEIWQMIVDGVHPETIKQSDEQASQARNREALEQREDEIRRVRSGEKVPGWTQSMVAAAFRLGARFGPIKRSPDEPPRSEFSGEIVRHY